MIARFRDVCIIGIKLMLMFVVIAILIQFGEEKKMSSELQNIFRITESHSIVDHFRILLYSNTK